MRAAERAVGAPIIGVEAVRGGMSPGPVALLTLGDGRQVFTKAAAAQQNARAYGLPYGVEGFVVAVTGMPRRDSLREPVPTVPSMRDWQAGRARSTRSLVDALVTR